MRFRNWRQKIFVRLILWQSFDIPNKKIGYCPLLPLPKKYRWEWNSRPERIKDYDIIYLRR